MEMQCFGDGRYIKLIQLPTYLARSCAGANRAHAISKLLIVQPGPYTASYSQVQPTGYIGRVM